MILRLMLDGKTNGVHDHKKDKQIAMLQCERNSGQRGFACRLNVKGGAGITGGFTVYFAYLSGSNQWRHQFRSVRRKLIEFGITRNANRVPYASR